jgi:hypothetical protein
MKKEKIDQLLEQVESLNSQIQKLKSEVVGEEIYQLTEQQMNDFVSGLYYSFTEWNQSEIASLDFSESIVSFEIDGNLIVPSVDSSMIADEIERHTDSPTEAQMMNMASEVMEDLKIKLI